MTLEEFLRKAIREERSLNATLDGNRSELKETKETISKIFVKLFHEGELDSFLKELELSPFNRKALQIRVPDKKIDLNNYDLGVEFLFEKCPNLTSLSLPKVHFITYISIFDCESLEHLTFTEDHLNMLNLTSNKNLKSVDLEKCKNVNLVIRGCNSLKDLKLPQYTFDYLSKEHTSFSISQNKYLEDMDKKKLIDKLFLNPDSDKRGAASIHDTGLFDS